MTGLIHSSERASVSAIAALIDCNPFIPERLVLEQQALGEACPAVTLVWHADGDDATMTPNAIALRVRVEQLGATLRQRLATGMRASAADLDEYERLVLYLLWLRYENDWWALIDPARPPGPLGRVACYERFAGDVAHFFEPVPGRAADAAHLFALGFQARRAFHYIFRQIFGGSLPAARLRAIVWQSIFTRDLALYREALYARMADIPTLIIGESGTGKELVGRAIALSQYIPFDPVSGTFATEPAAGFSAVNLAALNPALIESELFGHRRGAFTGAMEDRVGWFERCSRHGAVFLDEIGELDAAIQVKLLRVLQSREFHRLGETEPRSFAGKVIAATNRNIEEEIASGRFREDFYYRLCADMIHMPTLREQLAANPHDLHNLVLVIARRVAGPALGERLADTVSRYVTTQLGVEHAWHGNMRELEQCVRNIMIRGEYRPRRPLAAPPDGADELAASLRTGALTAEDMVQRYAELVHRRTRSLQETARRLGIDWRTVRKLVGPAKRNGQ